MAISYEMLKGFNNSIRNYGEIVNCYPSEKQGLESIYFKSRNECVCTFKTLEQAEIFFNGVNRWTQIYLGLFSGIKFKKAQVVQRQEIWSHNTDTTLFPPTGTQEKSRWNVTYEIYSDIHQFMEKVSLLGVWILLKGSRHT